MSHVPHELASDFPEYVSRIHDLKTKDHHFKQLAEKYHDLNRNIHRAETNVEPTSEVALAEMLKHRIQLKDQLYRMLRDPNGEHLD